MERQHRYAAAAALAACLLAGGALAGCAGPSTRVLPRDVVSEQPYEIPEENQVLEEVNPFYLQESLDYLSGFVRESGTPGEGTAAEYIGRLLTDYGYETESREFPVGDPDGGAAVRGRIIVGSRKAPSPDGDIMIIAANHDSMRGSPGANNNASGTVSLLECARLLSKLSTDTELRFVSYSGSAQGSAGAIAYIDSLAETERHRVIGAIQLDTLGYAPDARVVLGTADGRPTLLGDLLRTASTEVPGLTFGWDYTLRAEGDHIPFVRGEVPAVVVSQSQEAYEDGSPQDREEVVNVELLAGVVDIVSHTAAWIMSEDTPSQLAKSRYMDSMRDGAWVQQKGVRFPFGESFGPVDARIGVRGILATSLTDGAGKQVDTYQYRMKWFDVDQVILTNYHYSKGKLETISLDADGAGVEFEEMKERISSWYGEPEAENSGPNGTEYDWTDPVYHKFIALIPASDGFEVEIRDYTPERTVTGIYLPDGTVVEQNGEDSRLAKLLDLVRDIIPKEYGGSALQIAVYTDGFGDTACYLQVPEEEEEEPEGEAAEGRTPQAVIWIDMEDALSEDGAWRNRTGTVRLLVKTLGELVALSGEEDYMADYQARFMQEGAGTEEAAGTDAGADADAERAKPEPAAEDTGAAPGFSEDFMRFVLFQKPVTVRDSSDGRIKFFYNFEELVKIRTWIRSNLKLGDEVPAEMLPPESEAAPPEP